MSKEQDYFEHIILHLIEKCPKNDVKFSRKLSELLTDTLNSLEKAAHRRGRRSEFIRLSKQISKINSHKWHLMYTEMGEKDINQMFNLIKYDVIEQLSAEDDES